MIQIQPSLEEFQRLAARGNLIPVTVSILADRDTPVTVFERVKTQKYAFLLESVEHDLDRLQTGRYSFVGCAPRCVFEIRGGEIWREEPDGARCLLKQAPMEALRAELKRYRPVAVEGMPPFIGGLVGFLGYDVVRQFERLPDANPNDLDLPDGLMMLADTLIAVDHVRRRLVLLTNAFIDEGEEPRVAYERAAERLEKLRALIKAPAPGPAARNGSRPAMPAVATSATVAAGVKEYDVERLKAALPELPYIRSTVDETTFHAMVERAREYILAGDAFQIVGAQRFHTEFTCDPFDVYRSLRDVNPSPYMFYLQYGDFRIAGSSPEILVKLEGEDVQLRPIAGTRPRGATRDEDTALERDLLADAKEIAEHVMLVDLGRNDVGRVSSPSSVAVDQLMVIERYSHVMHIVSNVVGRLRPDRDAFDVLAACFPAGTLSGAPKIRAMEIIDELEPVRRGVYGGTVGYFSFNGNLDSCITIRTAVLVGQQAYVQAGGGWVADSNPATEYMETLNKARGVLRAIAQAEAGLD